jgi:hypothetical protein
MFSIGAIANFAGVQNLFCWSAKFILQKIKNSIQ